MSDAPLRGYNGRHEWFWEPGDEEHIFPLKDLMNMYYKSVGRNSTLIMGLTPNPEGLMPDPDVKRLKEWGDEIKRRFQTPIASTSGNGNTIMLKLNKPTIINHIIIQEDIQKGERVRNFEIEVLVKGKWKVLTKGESVGHKRILQIEDVEVSGVRMNVLSADREPQIKNLQVYFVTDIVLK